MLVHERGYLIAAARDGTFTFYRPGGTAIPASPALPPADGSIEDCHDADITPGTIIPPWYGERLDLDYAIYTCFANAANKARQNATDPPPVAASSPPVPVSDPPVPPAPVSEPPTPVSEPGPADQSVWSERFLPPKWAIEPQDWMPSLRHRTHE
jgi:hypothetical protein